VWEAAVVMAPTMFKNPDGSITGAVLYCGALALAMVAAGVWSLVAPEDLKTRYFGLLASLHAGRPGTAPRTGWGWGSSRSIRISGIAAIALALGFMTWLLFFTVPGRYY
jgi:hypothetical protein